MSFRTGMNKTIQIKVMKAIDNPKNFMTPFVMRNKSTPRGSFMVAPGSPIRLNSAVNTKRINSLTK